MLNNSKENEISSNKLLNGSEVQLYPNALNNNVGTGTSYDWKISMQTNSKTTKDTNKSKKNNLKLIRPELDYLKIIKIKLKTIKELITSKFDKAFKDLHNNLKNKKLILSIDILKSIENIKWKLIEEINDIEILNKNYEIKFNTILNQKSTQRNNSHLNNIKINMNNTNISSFSNPNKRNSFSDSILPTSTTNDKKIVSTILPTNKTPKINDGRQKTKIPYLNRSKSGTKINLNKSLNNKSYNNIKINLNNKINYNNIHDYIKNKKSKNNSILCNNSNAEESICENNIINSYKNKIGEKEKELSYIKEKLEKEKLINKNLMNELEKIKNNKTIQKAKNQFNQILNKNNSKNEELLIISNKLTKLIEMVINFSYSMAHLRSNVFSREKIKKNESIKNYENLTNDLKVIYTEFEIISKSLKNASGININIKNNELKNKSLNSSNTDNNSNINENKTKIDNINNNVNINNGDKKDDIHIQENFSKYTSSKKYKEINISSPIKEENSLEITNEEKMNIEEIKKNLNVYTIKVLNAEEKNKANNTNINNINNQNQNDNYRQINIIQNKNRHKKDEAEENDFEKSKRASLNLFMHTNSDKVFTFRNNSLISNKEGDKLTEKSGGGEPGKALPVDINKIIEENKNLKMQLASEMLKNNDNCNTQKSESHNDEEYEEIISGLKKKLEDKENKIKELQNIINTDKNNINNSFKYKNNGESEKMNNSMNEMEKIKGNYQENISTITDIYENMLIEKENKIKELTNEVNIIEKELEELNEKYEKEKENTKINTIKINGLENEKLSLLEQINTFKNKEKELKANYEKILENLRDENNQIKSQLNDNIKNYVSNYQNDNINDNNFNSASNRQINKQKEELILLKKKFKQILDDNNKLTNEISDYNLNKTNEKEEFINMMRNTFTKFLNVSKIDNKNKEYAIIVLKLLGYNDNDIKDIFKPHKKGIFGIFQ